MADQPPSFGECWMRSVDELVSSWVEESACGSEGYGAHHSPLPGCGDLAGIHHVTESRQLRWQLTERTLEIVEVGSLVNGLPLKSCGLRLFLGSGVLHSSGVSFVSRGSGSAVETCLCVATANQVLVRVSFRLNDVNDPSQSMFSNGQRDIFQAKFCEEKGWNPECVCRVDYDTVAFGCTNGALMIGNFWEAADVVGDEVGSQAISYTESFMRDSSMLKRIWSTMTLGYGNTPSSVIDICYLASMGLICTVGANSILRLWDLRSRTCVSAFELERNQQGGPLSGLRSITRFNPRFQVVVVYLKKDGQSSAQSASGEFHVLYIAGPNDQNPFAIGRDKTVPEVDDVQGNLSDFCLSDNGHLWASYVDEADPPRATNLATHDEVQEQAIQDGFSSRGCSVVYTSLEIVRWMNCKMNEFRDSSVSLSEPDSEKDWIISSLFRNWLFDSRSVFDAVVMYCGVRDLDVPSSKDWGRSSEVWNQPSSARMVQNLVAEVMGEKDDYFLWCLYQSWKRRNSVLALDISPGSYAPILVKVGGVSRLSLVPEFSANLGNFGAENNPLPDLLNLAYTADCLAEQRSTPFFLEGRIVDGEFLEDTRKVTTKIRANFNLSSIFDSIKELSALYSQKERSVGFDELRCTVSSARDLALGLLCCMWGDKHQSYPEALRLYLSLDLFHWAMCQPYESLPSEGGARGRRAPKRQEDPMGFSGLSLNAFAQESEPFFYFEKLFGAKIDNEKVTSSLYWSIFLKLSSVMSEDVIWMFKQLEYDRQWGTLRSLILRILSFEDVLSYSTEPILKYYLGLCHLHLGDPRRASVYFKEIIPGSPDIGGKDWDDQMGKFTEVVVCMGEVDAEFVARFFREDMSSHHPTRVVFNDVCCCVYYMKIAEYMNTLGLPSYICEFTELAVRCLTKDERTIETADDLYLDRYEQLQRDSNGSGMQERGRVGLYVTLFENYMILCDHSRALEAVVRMAEEERRNRRREGESETAKNSLRRLLVQLCDDKRLAVLCNRTCSGEDNGSFWGGANQMWLKENTEALLLEKAKVSDAMSPPDYYGALYAFYVSQNELRKAGSVMYLLGRRLAGEEALTRASLDKMARSFGCALNCLSFLEDQRKTDFYFVANSLNSPDEGEFSNQSVAKYGTILSQLRPPEILDHPLYVDPKHMRRLYYLVNAYRALLEREEKEEKEREEEGRRRTAVAQESVAISLAAKLYEVLDSVSGLSDQASMCIKALLQQEMYPMAIEMIDLFNVPMLTELFQSLTKKCVYSQLRTARFASFEGVVEPDGMYEYGGHLSPTEERWELLRYLLEHYDGSTGLCASLKGEQKSWEVSNYEYYCLVVETIYSIDRKLGLPHWLERTLKENDPAALLKIYLKYFQLEEGCDLCVYLYEIGLPYVLLPHLFMDRFGSLLGRYKERSQPPAIQKKAQELFDRWFAARKLYAEENGKTSSVPSSNNAIGFSTPTKSNMTGFGSPAPKSGGFSFGSDATKSSGFSSPAPKTTATAPSGGLSFGGGWGQPSSGFGSAKSTDSSSGFSSPAPKTTATAPSSGFSFGGGSSSTTSGFGSASSTDSNKSVGFSSPAPKTTEGSSGGFSFGGGASSTTSGFGSAKSTDSAPSSGFSSPASKTTAAAPSGGFSFGSDTTKSSGFSSPAPKTTETSSGGFSFGGAGSTTSGFGSAKSTDSAPSSGFSSPAPKTTAAAPSGGFSFGSDTTKSSGFSSPAPKTTEASSGSSGFSFGGGAGSTTSGFGSAKSTDSAPSSGFGSPAPKTTSAAPSGGFSFGGGASSTTSGFGSAKSTDSTTKTAEAPSGGFSFGGGASSTTSGFGSAKSTDSAPSGGFSFGGGSSSTTSGFGSAKSTDSATKTAEAPSGGFSFGGGSSSTTSGFGSAPKEASSSGGFSFGGGDSTKTTGFGATKPGSGFTFGGGDDLNSPFGAAKKDGASSTTSGGGFGFGGGSGGFGGASGGFGGGSGGFGGGSGGFSFGNKARDQESTDESEG